jgi:hydrogenase maturation protease
MMTNDRLFDTSAFCPVPSALPGVLVLGIGNVLMGDEGVGVHAIALLARDTWPGDVTLLDGGTGGFHLLSYLRDYEMIIMIDATLDGRPPGTIAVIRPRYATDFPRSLTAHDIGLRDLVEATALLDRLPTIHLITVSIAEIRPMTLELSPEVEAALAGVRQRVRALTSRVPERAHA